MICYGIRMGLFKRKLIWAGCGYSCRSLCCISVLDSAYCSASPSAAHLQQREEVSQRRIRKIMDYELWVYLNRPQIITSRSTTSLLNEFGRGMTTTMAYGLGLLRFAWNASDTNLLLWQIETNVSRSPKYQSPDAAKYQDQCQS